jgi:threonine/homoserine/homoserine lactone efflux protein
MTLFFSSLLPQFVALGAEPTGSMLGLGLVFVTMTLTWLSFYASVVARAGVILRRPRIRRAIDAVSGAILVAYGLRLATAER